MGLTKNQEDLVTQLLTKNINLSGRRIVGADNSQGFQDYVTRYELVNGLLVLKTVDEVYGSAWNGKTEVPTKNAVYDKIEALNLASGIYTPTLFNDLNISASTAYQCQYSRVGSVVTVSGQVDIDPIAAANTQLGISLPIASDLALGSELGGTAFCPAVFGQGGAFTADTGANRAALQFIPTNLANLPYSFVFQYRIN